MNEPVSIATIIVTIGVLLTMWGIGAWLVVKVAKR